MTMKKLLMSLAASVMFATSTQAQDVGVAECDAYLKYYAQCIEKSAGAGEKKMMLDAIVSSREGFLDLKTNVPQETLQKICKDTQTAMAQTFESLNCKPM
jgi:endonuclease III